MAVGGGAEIDAMFRNAVGGVFEMEPGVAQNCADAVQILIEDLQSQTRRARQQVWDLPATLESERQMHEGFMGKLDGLAGVLDEYVAAAVRLRDSFLIAGRILTEQDAEFAASLARAGQQSLGEP